MGRRPSVAVFSNLERTNMKTAVFSTKPYDTKFLVAANVNAAHEFDFYEEKLSPHTAKLAEGNAAICAFVNDVLNARVLDILQSQNIRMIALRCAGFNQVCINRTLRTQLHPQGAART